MQYDSILPLLARFENSENRVSDLAPNPAASTDMKNKLFAQFI